MQTDPTMQAEANGVSVREAYRRLGIGRTKFYQLLNSGVIAAFKIGRRTLINRASLEAFIEHPPTPYRCSLTADACRLPTLSDCAVTSGGTCRPHSSE